ncbi:MAG: hypothetical protein E7627_02425 [Ruminococcaceae bacterium]|nr:hypothetical protein [Oscillospiraceae bacterium]
MKEWIYNLICFVTLFFIFATAIWLMSREGFNSIVQIRNEDRSKYVVHRTELVPREDITSFCVDNENIYIFYDETALVNVYGTDGSYKYGIQISTKRKGRGNITAFNGKLYIESRRAIVFVFQEDQLVEIIYPDNDHEKYDTISELCWGEKNTSDGEHNYQLSESGNDIIRQYTLEIICDLPEKSKLSDNLLHLGLILLSFAFYGHWKLFEN